MGLFYDDDRDAARSAMRVLEKKAQDGDKAAAVRLRAAQAEVASGNWIRVLRIAEGKA